MPTVKLTQRTFDKLSFFAKKINSKKATVITDYLDSIIKDEDVKL